MEFALAPYATMVETITGFLKWIASDVSRGFVTGLAPEAGALSKRIQ